MSQPFHCWPASADQSICSRVWTEKHSSTVNIPDNHFSTHKMSSSLLLSKSTQSLSLCRVAECDPIAALAAIHHCWGIRRGISLWASFVCQQEHCWNYNEIVFCLFFYNDGWNGQHQMARKMTVISMQRLPVRHSYQWNIIKFLRQDWKCKLSTFAVIGATANYYSPGGRDRDRGLLSLLILTFVNLLTLMQQLLLKPITGIEIEL